MIQTYYDITQAFLLMYFILSEMNVYYCYMIIFASYWCFQLLFSIKSCANGLAGLKNVDTGQWSIVTSVYSICYNDLIHTY
jgi:hypothetical protein